jgi:predicted site-specific integrase-resolvase
MNLAAWAERNGVARVSAYRWFRAGVLPVPARKVGRLILVDEPASEAGPQPRTAVYARVSSADQKADLDRQVARVTAWATAEQIRVDKVVVEVGSALDGHRRKFLAVLRDQSVTRIVVEHRNRFCRFGSEYVQADLAAQRRELVVVDAAEVDDDLVGGYDRDPDLDVRPALWQTRCAEPSQACPRGRSIRRRGGGLRCRVS